MSICWPLASICNPRRTIYPCAPIFIPINSRRMKTRRTGWALRTRRWARWCVRVLTRAINAHLEELFPRVWVSGEISNFARAASGHWYFSLKDEAAQLRCVMFRMRAQKVAFMPREGDHIEVCGRVTMYEPRGECQLNAEQLRRTGAGRLYE